MCVQGSFALTRVARILVRPCLQQYLRYCNVPILGCQVQRRKDSVICAADASPQLQQGPDQRQPVRGIGH